mgnify:CR=1 FL=1
MSINKRRDMDVLKLMRKYSVTLSGDEMNDLVVEFPGPVDSLYEGAFFKVHVEIPEQYPYKSPSIGFQTKIFHPNIDETSGSICLDVINQTWSPMFELANIFDSFLPQLLLYPNAADPLNGEAAGLMLKKPELYNKRVKEMVAKYAMKAQEDNVSDISRDDLSVLSDTSDLDPDLL